MVRTEFAAADTSAASVNLIARTAIQTNVDLNETDGDADRALLRQQYIAADVVVNAAVALKSNKASPSFTGTVSLPNNTIVNSTAGRFVVNAQVFAFGNSTDATSITSNGTTNMILQTGLGGSGTIEISGAADGDINFYPNGTGRVKINKGVTLSGLPTEDPEVAGQLWNSSGTLMIST